MSSRTPDRAPGEEDPRATPAAAAAAYVRVALPLPLEAPLTYQAADGAPPPPVGVRVRVPLGSRNLVGFVVGQGSDPEVEPEAVRRIGSVLDREPVVEAGVLELCRWTADYYFASLGEVLSCAVPAPGGHVPDLRRLHLTRRARERPELLDAACARSRLRRELVAALEGSGPGGLGREELPRDARRLLAPLLEAGLAAWRPAAGAEPAAAAAPEVLELNAGQEAAVGALCSALEAGRFRPFLLKGVTGSGKTEVYLRAAEAALARGRGVLYLVPEIGLTPLLARQLEARFPGQVAVLHSAMARGERRQQWSRVREGRAPVVLGARSAVFAPLPDPGLVIVDEEQESSFKQEERPRYQGRDLAVVRARSAGATVVLGSATPSMETHHRAREGKIALLELPARVEERPMARAEAVDMREEFRSRGVADPFSRRLMDLLGEGLDRGEQSLLLLNRRGYATFVLCRACGHVIPCPRCSVSLVLHRAERTLRCHYCGHGRGIPSRCPECRDEHLHWGGEGTERLEEALRARLPRARLARLDRDTVRRRGAAERVLGEFARGELDILLGTQMIAKGHDFPRVTLVGVVWAESTLGVPDFRAAERTFQLITQVAGRSGRGDRPGRVVVQTFQPDHYAIRHACAQDYEAFYEQEVRFRRLLQYPPFTVLANLVVSRRGEDQAAAQAADLAREVSRAGAGFLRVLGPAPAPVARVRGLDRFQILVKSRSRGRLGDSLRAALAAHVGAGHRARHVTVDVDPVSLT